MVVMPLGPKLIDELGITTDQFSLIVASYSITAGVAGLLVSSIMDRFGRKAAYLGLFAGFLVGTLACGFAQRYVTLLAARALTERRSAGSWAVLLSRSSPTSFLNLQRGRAAMP